MREINVDYSAGGKPLDRYFNHCVSASRACLLLRADHQRHLEMAVRECGFRYLRFHGLFQDDMGVYREDERGNVFYSWQYVDEVYDHLMELGIRPFVVLDFMPEALASGKKTIYWEKSNITPPKDYGKWEELVFRTVEHFTARYGGDEVKNWFFEVWNEPDGFFLDGTLDDYLKLYEVSAHAVKRVRADYRVGGPAIAGDLAWMEALAAFCREKHVPIDFLSCHTYSVKRFEGDDSPIGGREPVIPKWEPGRFWPITGFTYDHLATVRSVTNAKKTADEAKLPLYYSEWGLTFAYWDPLHDACQAPSYMLAAIKRTAGLTGCLSFCEVSDVFEEDGPPTDHFHGGFGLVNLQGIRKPAYFAYWFLNRLKGDEYPVTDSDAIACREGDDISLLFWDCADRQNRSNMTYYLADVAPQTEYGARLTLTGLTPGEYRLTVTGAGYRRNDAYTAFLDIEKKASLSRAEVEALRRASDGGPMLEENVSIGSDGRFATELSVRDNDVYLIILSKKRKEEFCV